MEFDKIIDLTIKAVKENDDNIIQIIEEIKQGLYYQILPKHLKIMLNDALFNNGVFNKIDFSLLDEYQRFALSLWTLNFNNNFNNKYYISLFKHYQQHLNESIEKSNYNDLKFIIDYYQKTPSSFIIKDESNLTFEQPNLKNQHIKYISELIKIGSCIQFNCPGFVKNEFIYLISGLCVVYHSKRWANFENVKDLIYSIQSFIQLIPNSISIDGNKFTHGDKRYGLSTQLLFNENKGYEDPDANNFNYRYKPAFKYLKNEIKDGNTHITRDETGMRLNTEFNEQQLNELWEQLQIEYTKIKTASDNEKLKEIKQFLITWFDSQCLTRSTCLIGVLLLMILTQHKIKLVPDELIDWKAIICGNINDTFEILDKFDYFECDDFNNLTLLDVLTITKYYIEFVMSH